MKLTQNIFKVYSLYVWKCFKWYTPAATLPFSVFSIKYYVSIWEIEWQLYFRAASFSSCLNQFAIERTHTWHMHAYIFRVKIYGINFQFLSELFPSSYPTTQRYSMSLAVQYVCRLDAFITSPKNALECSEQWNIFRRQNVVRWIQQLE